MPISHRATLAAAIAALTCVSATANAITLTIGGTSVDFGAPTATIASDPSAATSNFQAPGATAVIGYDIYQTALDGNVYLAFQTTQTGALPFANVYYDVNPQIAGTGSNLGFELGLSTADAFDPVTSQKLTLNNISFYASADQMTLGYAIPDADFQQLAGLNHSSVSAFPDAANPDVSLHLSQTFGYSVVGGSANFAAPVELGLVSAVTPTDVPEPASMALLGAGILGLVVVRRRLG